MILRERVCDLNRENLAVVAKNINNNNICLFVTESVFKKDNIKSRFGVGGNKNKYRKISKTHMKKYLKI